MKISNEKKDLLIVLAPNLGLIDNILPLLFNLRKKNKIKIIGLILNNKITFSYEKNVVTKLLSMCLDEIIVTFDNQYFYSYNDFNRLYLKITIFKKFRNIFKIFDIIQRKIKFLKLNYFLNLILNLNEKKFFNYKKKFENLKNIIIDVGEINKFKKFLSYVPSKTNYLSFPNGIALAQLSRKIQEQVHLEVSNHVINKTFIFIFNKNEKKYYLNTYKIKKSNFIHIPILRHNNKWINKIKTNEEFDIPTDFQNYIILASKPGTNIAFPRENKIKMIKLIKYYFIEKLKFNVVIKMHPKEINDGLYNKIFGKENFKIKWFISNNHIFNIASKAKLCISFGGSLPIDLLNLNIPSIELRDLNNIKEFDNEYSIRDKNNNPISYLSYKKLFSSAHDYKTLNEAYIKISKNYDKIVKENKTNYNKVFLDPAIILNKIIKFF